MKINVNSRVLTRFNYSRSGVMDMVLSPLWERSFDLPYRHQVLVLGPGNRLESISNKKNAPPLGSHVFQAKVTIFELIQDIIGTNLLSKFHEDRKINVASRVLTRKYRENCPAPWQPFFSPIWTIFELVRDINETNVSTKFHDDWAKIVTSRVFTRNTATPSGGHVSTKFHDDWAKIVTSRVFTRNTATPSDWASNVTLHFELSQGINGTNVLTKFQEDRTINMASRVFTRQNVDAARRTKGDHKSSP
ncbi:hypothetical protein DPMN_159615 [Dreissena polymorpha]|uniref:Uncharacterized protein n=1 Tax=Dreissena polymorpha TaxID=45954 RepID=A0A9D4EPN5_DREPO|nr:hypothetical protein DPMN_159615 [Dreissena polymorpha]